jgi:spermidine/putrescine transport system permease protein
VNKFMKILMSVYVGLVYVFLYAPILVLVIFSFNNSRIDPTWHGLTFQWYQKAFHDIRILEALRNSLEVAAISTVASTILGTMAAVGLHRYDFRGKMAVEGLVYLPVIIPETVMGISLLAFFVIAKISLGLWTVVLSHIAFSVSFVIIIVRARLSGFDKRLEEAARDLGAGEIQTFRRITLPMAMPGILSGALMALTLSLDDFIITFFTAGPGSTTLPLRVFSMVKLGVSPEINAISTVLLLVTVLILVLSGGYQNRIRAVESLEVQDIVD